MYSGKVSPTQSRSALSNDLRIEFLENIMKKYSRELFNTQTESLLNEAVEATTPSTPEELFAEEFGKEMVKKIREYCWISSDYYDESNQEWVDVRVSLKQFIKDIAPNADHDEQFWRTLIQEDVEGFFLSLLPDRFAMNYSDFYLCLPDSLRQDEPFLERFTSDFSLDPRQLSIEEQATFSENWIKKCWTSSEQTFIGSKLANIPWILFSETEQKEFLDQALQSSEGRLSFLENKKDIPSSVATLIDVRRVIQMAYEDVLHSKNFGLKHQVLRIYHACETTAFEAGVPLEQIRLLYTQVWKASGDL